MSRSDRIAMLAAACVTLSAAGCALQADDEVAPLARGLDPAANRDPFPSVYEPLPQAPFAVVGVSIYTGLGTGMAGTVLVRDAAIEAIGQDIDVPEGYEIIDGSGRWLTPGLIDGHSHLGVGSAPHVPAHDDTNEATDPNTAGVWAEHAVWPQDPFFNRVRAGGVTTLQVLPGSSNLFNGRSVVLKNVPARTMQAMKFPGAPQGLKMACGENPKGTYGGDGRSPASRMGNVAGFRAAWIEAAGYARRWDDYRRKAAAGMAAELPPRDLRLDTLAGVLRGEILVHNHCYRADEMAVMIDVAKEFGYRIAAFHHASEAYKIADLLAREDICVMTWAGAWGAKMESFDGIEANAALVHAAGGCVVLHSDNATLAERLNQEAASALMAARRAGLDITKAEAITWVTSRPAQALGILERTGTIEPGKMADLVLWNADPFSIYAKADKVWIDGALVHDRHDARIRARSDFEVGQRALDELRERSR